MTKRKASIGRRVKRVFASDASRNLGEARRLYPHARMVLSTYPGVVGVGIGLQEQGGVATDRVAFIVTVRCKGGQASNEVLPRELLGFPVDVQEQPELPRIKTVAGGQRVQQMGLPPPGRLGCLVQDAAGQIYGLTAMHALVREQATEIFAWMKGPFFDVAVDQGDGLAVVGKLRAGEFTGHSDIACVEMAHGTVWQPGLAGVDTVLAAPADPWTVSVNAGIALAPSGTMVQGTVAQYPYGGDFVTDAGVLPFTELMKFRVVTPQGIRDGWSGSVLYDSFTHQPLALLSFGSDTSDDGGVATAYGFPLFAFYAAWNLRPV